MSPFREPWCIFDEYSYPDHFQSHYRIYPKTARRRNQKNRKGRSTGRKGAHAARWVGRRRHKVPRRVRVENRNGKRLGNDPCGVHTFQLHTTVMPSQTRHRSATTPIARRKQAHRRAKRGIRTLRSVLAKQRLQQHQGKYLKLEKDAVKKLMEKIRTAPPPPHTHE